ncbi:MAG: Mov34/MPN/PAD-1 family protein [Myxococcales bacterium]|nr:Mov34/MPN/PAD-1 family protein [Myxococcales bacterium]
MTEVFGGEAGAALWAALAAHAEAEAPAEACGLVVRGRDAALAHRPARNLAPGPGLFLLDPATLVASRRRGERLVALYHAHCDAPPTLSAADRRGALVDGRPAWPGVEHWIVEVRAGRALAVVRYRFSAAAGDFVVARGPAPG